MEGIIKHCDQLEGFAKSLRSMGESYKGECEREVKRAFEQRLAVAAEVKDEYSKHLAAKDQVIAAQKQTINNQEQTITWLRSQIDSFTQPNMSQAYGARVHVPGRNSPVAGGYQPRKRRRLNGAAATPTSNPLDVHEVKMENGTPVHPAHAAHQAAGGLSPALMARAMPRLPQFASHMETLRSAPMHGGHHAGHPWQHAAAAAAAKPKKPKSRAARPPGNKKGSVYKGISRDRTCGWRAQIWTGSKVLHIGYYGDDEVAAAKAWDKKARELRGEDTWTNFLPDGTRRPPKKKRSGYKSAAQTKREAKLEPAPVASPAHAPAGIQTQPAPPPVPAPPLEAAPPNDVGRRTPAAESPHSASASQASVPSPRSPPTLGLGSATESPLAPPPGTLQAVPSLPTLPAASQPAAAAQQQAGVAPADPRSAPEPAAPPAAAAPESTFYQVEQILDQRLEKGVEQFYVKWRGFGEDKNTWEPVSNFETGRDDPYIQTFLANLAKRAAQG